MSAKTKGMILDANGYRPAQYYDPALDSYIAVTRDNPYPILISPKHTKFVASQGTLGWITTTEVGQVFDFSDSPLNTLIIQGELINGVPVTTLQVQINDDTDIWYIEGTDGIEDIQINKITILNSIGTKIKYRGLCL